MRIALFFVISMMGIKAAAWGYKLTPYIPSENPTKTAIIVCPGGSYFWLDTEIEGVGVAQWLNTQGIAAFVLEYHHAGWAAYAYHFRAPGRSFPAGHNDLVRALREVRSQAQRYGYRADRVGCMGFSAGGHLVMHTAEQLAGTSDCPWFVAPIYPVVSMTHPCTHRRSRRGLLGEFPKKSLCDSLSLEHHVPVNCPPVFLMNCYDDPIVNYRNSELLDSALTVKKIPHLYQQYRTGGHGFGATESVTTGEAAQWKKRFIDWLKSLL